MVLRELQTTSHSVLSSPFRATYLVVFIRPTRCTLLPFVMEFKTSLLIVLLSKAVQLNQVVSITKAPLSFIVCAVSVTTENLHTFLSCIFVSLALPTTPCSSILFRNSIMFNASNTFQPQPLLELAVSYKILQQPLPLYLSVLLEIVLALWDNHKQSHRVHSNKDVLC